MTKTNTKRYKYLKLAGKVLLGIILLFFILVLIIRTPWGQNFIVGKITNYVSNKTNTKVEIDRAFVTFSGDIQLDGVYLEDKKRDTLLYSKSLQADIPIAPILFGNQLSIDNLYSNGLVAHIKRETNSQEFNFTFLIDAFNSPTDTETTSSEPLEINLGEFHFKDWKFTYTDAYLGTNLKLNLQQLNLEISEFDLEQMKFSIDELNIDDTQFAYKQVHAFPVSNDTTSTAFPYIKIEYFELNNVDINYISAPDELNSNFNLGSLNLTDILADVSENQYETEDLILKNSRVSIRLNDINKVPSEPTNETEFSWPTFLLATKNLELENNSFSYVLNNTPIKINAFDADAFEIEQLKANASDFIYEPKKFNLNLLSLSFNEASGIHLDNLAFKAGLTNTNASLSELSLKLNNSSANADFSIDFDSLENAIENPQKSSLAAAVSNLVLEMKDVLYFMPELRENPYLNTLTTNPITGSLNANGNLKKVGDFKTNLNWGPNTKLSGKGNLSNLTVSDSLKYVLNNINLNTTQKDLLKFISSKDLGISVPKTLVIAGSLSGGTNWIQPNLQVKIPEGIGQIDARVDFGESLSFKGGISTDTLELGSLLQNDKLGQISLDFEGSGSGTAISNLDADLEGTISKFQFNGYEYANLDLTGKILDGSGTLAANISDPNLNMTVNSILNLNATDNDISLKANIIGADLQKIGLTKNNIKIAADLTGTFKGTPSNFNIETNILEGIAVADNEQYQVSTVHLKGHIEDSITDVSLNSDFINGALSSNASPERVITALKKQLEYYFRPEATTYKAEDDVIAELSLAIEPTPILSNVFLTGIEDLDSLKITANFDSRLRKLSAAIKVPKISYAGSAVDSLNAFIKGDSLDLKFSAGIGDLVYEPLHLKQTFLEGSLRNKKLVMEFNSINDTVQVMHIGSELVFKKDTLSLHIDPVDLILNKKKWAIPEDNSIILTDGFTNFENLILTRNTQSLEISNKVPKMETEHIGILFENFQLQTFLSLLNPDDALSKGKVAGNLVILNPYNAAGLVADLRINNFEILQNPLGVLQLNAASKSFSDYDFDLALKEGGANIRLTGDYIAKESSPLLNLELDIQKLETSIIQGFLKEELSNPKGYLTGSMLVGGTLESPSYSGRINFEDMGLTLASYNTALNIDNQSLDIDDKKLSFNTLQITDVNGDAITLNGKITTEKLTNPGFDFSVKTDRFRILDSKKGDNELVYGIASVKANANVSGNLELPVVNGQIRVRDITDLTYVVPQDQLEIQEREGVVIFVNRENPDAILTRNEREGTNSFFSGMDINTTLEIANEAEFTIILDEKTQDKLKASGEATLNLNIDPNEDIRLSGRLELNSGFYRTSLYNLVSREFKLQPGSSIVWSGDPYDAKMDVTAIYEIETSASPLMSAISYGQDSGVAGRYQQSAPFLVYLNIDGQLMEPELSFGLDMPEKAQGNFGGAVYGRIQQLNEQESELNKQVFSLLALNRFYPTTGSDGSNGGAISLARNNVNKVLSSELNSISNKLLGKSGFQLGFDLDSFEDYQTGTAQSRTQLNINASKKLFDDRLIVTAGSAVDVEGNAAPGNEASPLIGNVTLEYLLNEAGTYRMKGFRKQEYQNVIDGQLIVTGIAFIINREFNKFSQLFRPMKKENQDNPKKTEKDN